MEQCYLLRQVFFLKTDIIRAMSSTSISRRNFLRASSAAALTAAFPVASIASEKPVMPEPKAAVKGPKRGVSFYSYSAEFGFEKNLEDCFEDVYDMGAHGIEILANTHIENYPNPSEAWIEHWWHLCRKYDIQPVEYGHWVDGRVMQTRMLSVDETLEYLTQDMHLAHRLGFTCMRTKMTVKDSELAPIDNWKEVIRRALPLAERLNLVLLPEIHTPSSLKSAFVQEYVDFIKETGTRNFGLNLDFSLFRTTTKDGKTTAASQPEDIIPLLPYIYCLHAKLFHMNDEFDETEIPYKRILQILKDHNWDGYLLSEYEGSDKYDDGYEVGQTLRKQHIMMKRILGA